MEPVTPRRRRPWRNLRLGASPLLFVEAFEPEPEGLAAAHRVGVVHRDFKPANVLVGEDKVAIVYYHLGWNLAQRNRLNDGIAYLEQALDVRKKVETNGEYLAANQLRLAQTYWLRDPADQQASELAKQALPALRVSTEWGKDILKDFESWSKEHLSMELHGELLHDEKTPS